MALYFECSINKNALLQTVFFGDFVHWDDGTCQAVSLPIVAPLAQAK